MNVAHIHIVINHLPIVGYFFSVFLITMSFYFRSQEGVFISAVLIMVISALGALAAYFSGSPSIKQIATLPGVGHKYINYHYKRARLATLFACLSGITAIACGAIVLKLGTPIPIYCYALMLISASITSFAMVFTGNAGGKIRHQEVRDEEKK